MPHPARFLHKTWPHSPDVSGSGGHRRTEAADVSRAGGRNRTHRTGERSLKPPFPRGSVGSNPTPGTRSRALEYSSAGGEGCPGIACDLAEAASAGGGECLLSQLSRTSAVVAAVPVHEEQRPSRLRRREEWG